MKLYKTTKTVFRITNNPSKFLHGLTSNDLDKPQNAFLNIHGRIIATFDQLQINEDEFLIILEDAFVERTLIHIDRYVKLSGVKLEKLVYNVYFCLDEAFSYDSKYYRVAQKKGQLIIIDQDLNANVAEEEFTLFRLNHHIAWQGIDYTDEFLLNVSEEDFVSFTKGCFLGQEPVSKVHNRSQPSWKLCVKLKNDCSKEEQEKMTSQVQNPEDKEWMGFVFVSTK